MPEAELHPWIAAFAADPDRQLADFLAGYAPIAPYSNADRATAARLLFGALPPDHEALSLLDVAVLRWLEGERQQGQPDLEIRQRERWRRQIMDAFRLVSMLGLKQAAVDFRRRTLAWRAWTERHSGGVDGDVRAEYLSTLALTQRLVSQAPGITRLGLEPFWVALCEQSGGVLPATYLHIGLLGLRNLPERADAPNDRPWMLGLARWATLRRPAPEAFAKRWYALKALYPRTPAFWRRAISELLDSQSLKEIPGPIQQFWLEDVGGSESAPATTIPRRTIPPPSLDTVNDLLARSGEPLTKIRLEIKRLISECERYAAVTGESHYLVRTACNLGKRLLELAPLGERAARGAFSVDLARSALAWQPQDVVVWGLWVEALAASGQLAAAELVGWEAVRRFPEDPVRRNVLSQLLAHWPGRQWEAEKVLRETARRFPKSVFTWIGLATLLRNWPGRFAEALAVVEEGLANTDGADELAVMREKWRSGPLPDATDRQADWVPADPFASQAETPETDELLNAVLRGGRIRRLAAYHAWKSEDEGLAEGMREEARALMAADSGSAYVRYLHDRITGAPPTTADGESSGVGDFGVAFLRALDAVDAQRLDALERAFPDLTQLYGAARMFLFRDVAAGEQTIDWLRSRPVGEARPVLALRGFLGHRLDVDQVDTEPQNLELFLEAIAANDNVRLDLIEAALAPWDLALAA